MPIFCTAAVFSTPAAVLVIPTDIGFVPLLPPPPDAGRNGLPGETIGGLQKLKTEEPPGPVGVTGRGPGEAVHDVKYVH